MLVRSPDSDHSPPDVTLAPLRSLAHWLATASALLVLTAPGVVAQSLQVGRLEGTVVDAAGAPVALAEVRVAERSSGATRSTATLRDGTFRFAALPEGRYDLSVEALGYRPVLQRDLRVNAGPVARAEVTLQAARGVVAAVDTAASPTRGAGAGQWLAGRGYGDLVGGRRIGGDLAAFSTLADANAIEGLPWRYSSALIDGANASLLASPAGSGADAAGLALPVRGLATVSVGGLGYDAEVGGSGLGVRATTRRGGRAARARVLAEGGAENRGAAAAVDGPLHGDTAQAVFGADYQRIERALEGGSGVDTRSDERSGAFGRFDWQASDRLVISARASGNHFVASGPALREGLASAYGRSYEAVAGQAMVNVYGYISERLRHEWRVSTDFSSVIGRVRGESRRDLASDITRYGREANGRFDEARTTPRLSGMLHAELGAHRLKAGFSTALHRLDSRYLRDADGWYALGDASTPDAPGAWRRVENTPAAGEHRMGQSALFVQDAWEVADGFSLLIGARMDMMRLPARDIERNDAWLAATGLDNSLVRRSRSAIAPRVGLRWELGETGAWLIEAGAGTYNDLPDARDVAEALTLDRGADARYGVGLLPVTSDPTLGQAPVIGTTLTMLAPRFNGPRTQRFSLGISHRRGEWNASVGAVLRHTDFLSRRRDLNLSLSPVGEDQYGRPLFGTLSQQGAALFATPGANRRFSGFDAVHLLESTGFSEFWALSAGIERVVDRGVSVALQYTYSRTTDNIASFGGTTLSPFPDGIEGGDWLRGRSDLDVPHRALLALDWRPTDRVALGAVYRLRSGLPFTPGLRRGVDANGDGDWTNDPAYVDAALPGLDAILADNDCVRPAAGGFVARNSCREGIAHGLDLRFEAGLARTLLGQLSLVVDALDVTAPPVGALDRALLLVDPSGSTTTDPLTGITTIPYIANPDFGERRSGTAPGVFWRVGLRITP